MTKLIIIILCIITICHSKVDAQPLSFTITGNIKGIEKGDTLRFYKIDLPRWKQEKEFEIVVENDGVFKYNGSHPHTQYYMMQYFPIGKSVEESEKLGLTVLIKDGKISIDGIRDEIYLSNITGGFYDREFAKVKIIEDSLSRERSLIIKDIEQKRKEKDTIAMVKLSKEFNMFHNTNAKHFKRLKSIRNAYELSISNEYLACELCQKSYEPLEKLETGYKQLSSQAQKSYYGVLLNSIIEQIKCLSAGQPAPDFTLTTTKGDKISLSDFRGKYLLIYHFGLCPGSMQVDSLVTDLYNNNKDKLEVIGLTESFASLIKIKDEVKKGEKFMNMDLKKIMTDMTSHKWQHEAETKLEDNESISKTYNIQGLPFFVFISPDGKIITHGYWEAFNIAKAVF